MHLARCAARCALACGLMLAPSLSASAADWPQFRGVTGQGVGESSKLPTTWSATENVVWKAPLPGAGSSSPIVAGQRVFVTCYSGYEPGKSGKLEDLKRHLLCFDRASGKQQWSVDVAAVLPEEQKIRDHGYAGNTPAADSDKVYAFFGKSGVYAYTLTGKQVWKADVGSSTNGWGSAASPVVHGDLVLINASVESESFIALDKQTGAEKWRAKGIKESWNTPVLVKTSDGKTEAVLAIHGKVLGFDPADGKQLWSCNTDIGWYMVPSVVAAEGVVYCIGGRSGGALAVRAGGRGDVTQSHRLWTGKKGSNVSSPILHNGKLYWAHEGLGLLYCAEAQSGEILYEQRLQRAGQVYASPVLAGGALYYFTREGKAFVVAAKPTFEQLATNELEERGMFNGSPAVAGDQLFVRSDKYLYCLGTK